MVDEVHQAKADVLKKLLTGPFANVPIRWGLTGTIPKAEHERLSLEISLGEVTNSLSAHELQDLGVLANCEVNVIQLQDTISYGDYQSELTYLTTNKDRLDYMAELITKLGEGGNTLVLVDRIKAGQGLLERLGEETVFISANNGGIDVGIGVGNTVGHATTPKMLAYILDTHNVYGSVMFTSSMDFADEYGFDHYNGAKDLWNEAVEMRV